MPDINIVNSLPIASDVSNPIKMIIGTTGFDEVGKAAISAAAKTTAIMFAPNMSVGVNVTMKLLEMAAKSCNTRLTLPRIAI